MSKRPATSSEYRAEDTIQHALEGLTRLIFWAGLAATVIGLGFLIYTYVIFSGPTQLSEAQALTNIGIFSKILLAGVLALGVATAFQFWGEETLGVLQLGFGAFLYFSPLVIPMVFGGQSNREAAAAALRAIQTAGQFFGAFAILIVITDITVRIRQRSQQGARADQLKYGKGVKEERDIRNVFMGKCWQLPFCRKFVRERCPIYHAKRTCWKERVGCMCEEEVIRNAMENKPIPKDELLAGKYIPYNNKLTEGQKAERCRQCVIYNEHQKHKYKLMLPVTIAAFVSVYLLFRAPLLATTATMIKNLDRVVAGATYRADGKAMVLKTTVFEELLLAAFMIVAFAYIMKLLEYLIFRLKV